MTDLTFLSPELLERQMYSKLFVSVSLTQLVDLAEQLVLPGAALQPPLLFNHEVSHHLPQCLNINGTGYNKITGYFLSERISESHNLFQSYGNIA